MATGITKITLSSVPAARYQQKIQAGPHIITADEPKSLGGDGTGATPISLLLGALGACTAITLKMYAERKGYVINKIDSVITHEKQGDQDIIHREIILQAPTLTAEQRARMMQIADMCPVHKMLSGSATIHTRERHE